MGMLYRWVPSLSLTPSSLFFVRQFLPSASLSAAWAFRLLPFALWFFFHICCLRLLFLPLRQSPHFATSFHSEAKRKKKKRKRKGNREVDLDEKMGYRDHVLGLSLLLSLLLLFPLLFRHPHGLHQREGCQFFSWILWHFLLKFDLTINWGKIVFKSKWIKREKKSVSLFQRKREKWLWYLWGLW